MTPHCPRCGSAEGFLGTSFAYFCCPACKAAGHDYEQYWTPDHQHPNDWQSAIDASPWATARQKLERGGERGVTMQQAAECISLDEKFLALMTYQPEPED